MASEVRYSCGQCSSSFRRPEHLTRHQRSHQDSKPYACSICSKAFSRSDTAARHEVTHTYSNGNSQSLRAHGPGIASQNRACSECAKARARCSKGRICTRCAAKSLRCAYPPRRRRAQHHEVTTVDVRDNNADQQNDPNGSTYTAPLGETQTHFESNDVGIPPLPNGTSAQAANPPNIFQGSLCSTLAGPGELGLIPQREMDSTASRAQDMTVAPAIPLQLGQDINVNAMDGSGFAGEGQLAVNGSTATSIFDPWSSESLELPINWLPTNIDMNVDYSSILGVQFAPDPVSPDDLAFDATLSPQVEMLPPPEAISHMQTQNFGNIPRSNTSERMSTPVSHISSSSTTTSSAGALYATSIDGARLPCTVRNKKPDIPVFGGEPITPTLSSSHVHPEVMPTTGFPDLQRIIIDGFSAHQLQILNHNTFQRIYDVFVQHCLNPNSSYVVFETRHFPLLSHVNYFTYLFFERFHPVLSVFHKEATDLNDNWLLALAVIAIGTRFTKTEEFAKCIVPMHELLRRAVTMESEIKEPDLSVLQALLLNHIGILYTGSHKLAALSTGTHEKLVTIAKELQLLHRTPSSSHPPSWRSWIQMETRRRMGYAIWLIDSMRVYHFSLEPFFSISDAQAPLPDDALWEAKTAEEWAHLANGREEFPSLASAVQTIFVEGKVMSSIGEMGRITILHGIYHEIWDVARYFMRPLAFWQSSASRFQASDSGTQSIAAEKFPRSRWLPQVPTFSNWRNAACDCIDVLHWAANATIAQLNGAEHPTVFHLHFSRMVLLVPHDKIRFLAAGIVSKMKGKLDASSAAEADLVAAEREVIHWAQRDEHKARLAMIHAGCLLWHIRRYSVHAFYEPPAVFLSILSLWAYSSYTQLAPSAEDARPRESRALKDQDGTQSNDLDSDNSSPVSEPEPYASQPTTPSSMQSLSPPASHTHSNHPLSPVTPRAPSFILLDRPNDDEMVQLFVRAGKPSNIRAYISGVGNIYSLKGPHRILREGRKILASLASVWGIAREHIALLAALETVVGAAQRERQDVGAKT